LISLLDWDGSDGWELAKRIAAERFQRDPTFESLFRKTYNITGTKPFPYVTSTRGRKGRLTYDLLEAIVRASNDKPIAIREYAGGRPSAQLAFASICVMLGINAEDAKRIYHKCQRFEAQKQAWAESIAGKDCAASIGAWIQELTER